MKNFHMGMTAELVAEKYNISRERQDQYAVESHRRAVDAIKSGRFKDEIVPVSIPQKKGEPIQFAMDESPRADTSLEALGKAPAGLQAGRHSDGWKRAREPTTGRRRWW